MACYVIDSNKCVQCLACMHVCPVGAIKSTSEYTPPFGEIYIDIDECVCCGSCYDVCPVKAVIKV